MLQMQAQHCETGDSQAKDTLRRRGLETTVRKRPRVSKREGGRQSERDSNHHSCCIVHAACCMRHAATPGNSARVWMTMRLPPYHTAELHAASA